MDPLRDNWLRLAAAIVQRAIYDVAGMALYLESPRSGRRSWYTQTARRFLRGPLFANIVEVGGGDPGAASKAVLARAAKLKGRPCRHDH